MVWIEGNFYNLSAPFHQDQRYTVYYFQETSVKLVYLEDLSTGIGIIPEAIAITGLTERVQELTDVSYTYKWNKELYRTFSNMGENKSHKNIKLMNFYTSNCSLVYLVSKAKWKS